MPPMSLTSCRVPTWRMLHFSGMHTTPACPARNPRTPTTCSVGTFGIHTSRTPCQLPGTRTNATIVLLGKGEVPVKETVRVLASHGYRGFYCFEWEKRWHPDIDEPEVSFPHYARTIREYLSEFGIKA